MLTETADNLSLLCCVSTASSSDSAQKDPQCMRPISQLHGLNGKFISLGSGAGGVSQYALKARLLPFVEGMGAQDLCCCT